MTTIALAGGVARDRRLTLITWWVWSRVVTFLAFTALWLLGPHGWLGEHVYATPFSLLGTWDGKWYERIATNGYLLVPGRQSDPAFFPLYPILVRLLHDVSGLSPLAAGVILANAAFPFALLAFYEVGRLVVGDDVAYRGAIFAAIAPMSYVASMVYPETLVLALGCLALLAGLRRRWGWAAVLGAVAALTRPEATALALPIAAAAWRSRGTLDAAARGRAVAAVLAPPLALASYPLYLGCALGNANAWSQAEQRWGRSFRLDGPVITFFHTGNILRGHVWLARDLVLLAAYAVLLVVAARRGVRAEWIVAGAAILLVPLFSGTFESEGRFGLLALPVYWGLAAIAWTRRRMLAVQAVSLGLLVAGVLSLPYVWP